MSTSDPGWQPDSHSSTPGFTTGPSNLLIGGLGLLVLGLVVAIAVVLATDPGDGGQAATTTTTTTSMPDSDDLPDEDEMARQIGAGLQERYGVLIDDDESACLGGSIVDAIGEDELFGIALDLEHGDGDPEAIAVSLASDDAEDLGRAMAACLDDPDAFVVAGMADDIRARMGHILTEDESRCVADAYRDVLGTAVLLGLPFSEEGAAGDLTEGRQNVLVGQLVDCVGNQTLNQLRQEGLI